MKARDWVKDQDNRDLDQDIDNKIHRENRNSVYKNRMKKSWLRVD